MNNHNKNKLIDRAQIDSCQRGWGLQEGKVGEGGYTVKDGNQTVMGDHFVVCTNVELQCCTSEIYNVIHQFYLN